VRRRGTSDRGTAAVEFALTVPILLLIVFGIIDFGRALNAQIQLTGAAGVAARAAALGEPAATVDSQAAQAAPTLTGVTTTIVSACPASAAPGQDASVNVSYQFSFITPVGAVASFFGVSGVGAPLTLTAQSSMACET
jgi:Flp pilus assembly protein TadG